MSDEEFAKFKTGDRVKIVSLDLEELEDQTDVPADEWKRFIGQIGEVTGIELPMYEVTVRGTSVAGYECVLATENELELEALASSDLEKIQRARTVIKTQLDKRDELIKTVMYELKWNYTLDACQDHCTYGVESSKIIELERECNRLTGSVLDALAEIHSAWGEGSGEWPTALRDWYDQELERRNDAAAEAFKAMDY